ncbi:MAG: amidohydrolase family protein [Chitinophagaceae bacterium]
MKKILLSVSMLLAVLSSQAQETIYPAKAFSGKTYLVNGTVHTGDGKVLEKTTVVFTNGKITEIAQGVSVPAASADVRVVDVSGKQVYPGLILPDTDLGLKEIGAATPGSDDYDELGEYNSDIRSVVAYDATSMIIGTLRTNGILLASVSPQSGVVAGLSSVVQLDAWNWEDASYKVDNNLHVHLPSFSNRPSRMAMYMRMMGMDVPDEGGAEKKAVEKLEEIKAFFRQAQSYFSTSNAEDHNLKFEAIRGLFEKKQKLFVHADEVKQILAAIDFSKEFGFDVVIVGGTESWRVADLLKKNNIAVILKEAHSLPTNQDDDFDQPYKTPYLLQKAGVLYALNDTHDETRYRNLMFNAGTAAAYGLTKEEALQAITLNAAKILGIDDKTGTIAVGKDANVLVSEGDILDMRTSILDKAYIQGRDVSLENKQTQLYDRYIYKYGLNK